MQPYINKNRYQYCKN